VTDSSGGASGEPRAPASVNTAGRLLRTEGGRVSALFSVLGVARASFTSTTPEALIDAVGTTLNAGGLDPISNQTTRARLVQVLSSATAGTPASATSMSIQGPLARLENAALTVTSEVLGVFNGGSFNSATSSPLIQAANSTVTAGTAATTGRILQVSGSGGPTGLEFAVADIAGPVLVADSTPLDLNAGLVHVFADGQLIARGSGDALAVIQGGSHAIASNAGRSMVELTGRTTATATEFVDEIPLELGADRSIRGVGPTSPIARGLVDIAAGATVTSQKIARFDHTLFEATAPIFRARGGSNVTTTGFDALDLSIKSKVTSLGPVVALDASTLTVNNGAAVFVNRGSLLQVNGDLFSLVNGSALRTLNGPAVQVRSDLAGTSMLHVSGGLVAFGGSGGNQINVNNAVCGGPCAVFNGIPVGFVNGANAGNISIGPNPIRNAGLGSIVTSGPSAAVIVVDGANSRVVISAP
jgi:hypothetical protein